jgi:hypothetical protein
MRWHAHPAFLLGLYLLIAAAGALYSHLVLLVPASLLLIVGFRRSYVLCALLFYAYIKIAFPLQAIPETHGSGHFSISSLKVHASPFNRTYAYMGTLKKFTTDK